MGNKIKYYLSFCFFLFIIFVFVQVFKYIDVMIVKLKEEVNKKIDKRVKMVQVMVDKVFSFVELGFQEFEFFKYLIDILKENGFKIEYGIFGVFIVWWVVWGLGKFVIVVGSDFDCILKVLQWLGVVYYDLILEGVLGYGEGYNLGILFNILVVIFIKEVMEKEGIFGILILWLGVVEELVGIKVYFIRDGYFDDVDLCIFIYVFFNFIVFYG